MKIHIVRPLRLIGPALALLAAAPLVPAQQFEAPATAVRALLQDLDAQLAKLDEFVAQAPNATEKSDARSRVDQLKERRAQLNTNFDQTKFESLKADVKAEYEKLSAWAKQAGPSAHAPRVVQVQMRVSR